jgi:GH24 family phage-related lysozyme (muramidase)
MAFKSYKTRYDTLDRFVKRQLSETKASAGEASRARTKKMIGLGQSAAAQTEASMQSSAQGVRKIFNQVDIGGSREETNPDLDIAAWMQGIEETVQKPEDIEVGPPLIDPDVEVKGDLISFIAGLEGFKEKAYEDYGQISIGFGTKAGSLDETISREQAMKDLTKEVMKSRTIVLKAAKEYGYDWTENQVDALTSFTYNTGQGGFNQLIEGGTRGDEEISEMMLEYNKAGGKVLEGLVKRRKAEAKLFTQGYER